MTRFPAASIQKLVHLIHTRRARWAVSAAGAALLAAAVAGQQFPAAPKEPAEALAAMKTQPAPETTRPAAALPAPIPVKIVRVQPSKTFGRAPEIAAAELPDTANTVTPSDDDPRWAREVTVRNATELPRVKAPSLAALSAEDTAVETQPLEPDASLSGARADESENSDDTLDPIATASLPSGEDRVASDAGELDREVDISLPEENKLVPTPRPAAVDPAPEAAGKPAKAAARAKSRVNDDVNMRSAGRSGSKIITVIPANTVVEVIGCGTWCEVSYEGRTGFVYKSFVGSKSVAKPKQTKKVVARKPAATTTASARSATVKQPEAAEPQTVDASAAATEQRTGILKCGFFRKCATFGSSDTATLPAAQTKTFQTGR